MPRYAVADNLSGVIHTFIMAPDPVSACRLFDLSLGNAGRSYDEHDPRSRSAHATVHAYAVYKASPTSPESPMEHGVRAEQVDGLAKVAVVVVRGP